MARTIAQLLTDAGDRLADANHARFSAPMLRRWINEATREIARRAECFFTSGTVSVVAGTQSYALPAGIVRLQGVEFTASSQTYPIDYVERVVASRIWGINQTQQSAWPEYYTTEGIPGTSTFTLKLFPVPSQAGTLNLFYFRLPTERATDGSDDALAVDTPNGWEDLVLDYLEARAYRRDGQVDQYQASMQAFTERLIAVKETGDNNFNTAPRAFVPDDLYGMYDGLY